MDYETVSADEFGRSLTGVGVNLLTKDVIALADFLVGIFGATAHRVSEDFAIVRYEGTVMQIHADGTYGSHPVLGLLPENPPRGGGLQLFLFGADPVDVVAKAESFGGVVIEEPKDKPHGLREATVLSPEGYAFTAAVATAGD